MLKFVIPHVPHTGIRYLKVESMYALYILYFAFFVKNCRHLNKAPMSNIILLVICSICILQLRYSSRIRPKYLIDVTLSNITLLIFISISLTFFFCLKIIYLFCQDLFSNSDLVASYSIYAGHRLLSQSTIRRDLHNIAKRCRQRR